MSEAYYLVLDHGKRGRESIIDWEDCSRLSVIHQIERHDYTGRVIAVHCIDVAEQWCRDVSEDIAREICDRVVDGGLMPTGDVFDFCEDKLGCERMAELAREMVG